MKRKTILLLLGILIIIGAGVGLKSIKQSTKGSPTNSNFHLKAAKKVAIKEPLIMVPGSGGTVDSYDSMINKLRTKSSQRSTLKLTINQNNQVKATGKLTATSLFPFIVVAFEDSSDEAISKQGHWFGTALRYLKKHYQFSQFNYLGHSNGGPIITYYFEEDAKKTDPRADRLLFLGAPFNGITIMEPVEIVNGKLNHVAPDLKPLLANKKQIPANLKVRNIYSDTGDDSDGIVPVESVKAGKWIYRNIADYDEHQLADKVNHVWLLDSAASLKEIEQFFLVQK